jgi:FSR family fosmidomycin resistance protein-like MFS transporter
MSFESNRAVGARAFAARAVPPLALTLLLVEFLDEVVDGVGVAAWPLVRDDLRLGYAQVGLLLTAPTLVGSLLESWLFILADVWRRRVIVLAGGFGFALALLSVGLSSSFAWLLAAFVLFSPSSGAFVNLSQAALMDAAPARREQNMARWTLAGSLGNTAGPLLLAGAAAAGAGWRAVYAGLAVFALVVLGLAWRAPFPTPAAAQTGGAGEGFLDGLRAARGALRRGGVWRWLVLLQFGDLTADVLRGYLALYLVDVAGAGEAGAAWAVFVWTCVGLPGDFLLLPLLERVRGLSYLRVSTAAQAVLFPAFLLAEGMGAKLVLVGLLGLANAGWFAVLQAQLYASLPGRSGTALTLGNLSGLAGSLVPFALGAFAERYGLGAMMWLLAAGPVVMLVGLWTAKAPGSESQVRDGL